MFLDMLSPSNTLNFPTVQNVGTLYQDVTDGTQVILTFTGTPYGPGNSTLGIDQSFGPSGPWTNIYARQFVFTGSPYPNLPVVLVGPYYPGMYFRFHWENVTLGYVGPYSPALIGPTVKLRWDTSTVPIAPTAIVSTNPVNTGFGLPQYIDVTVKHSLANSSNYSNKGIYVSATGIINGFLVTKSAYFVGWGSAVGVDELFRIPFGTETYPITAAPNASARYYVLGDPLPGILGTPANY